ncbi:Uncharacterised protein [Mycobacteroides abscessus subsp. abscessus]|nr:Uncharacterised protein [Mycobacteroides abscessus subsp. abscessus]
MTIVDTTADMMFTLAGEPLPENFPSHAGPAPSVNATACARLTPMAQAVPLVNRPMISPAAATWAVACPSPCSSAVPSGATLPPYTVNTARHASTNPVTVPN